MSFWRQGLRRLSDLLSKTTDGTSTAKAQEVLWRSFGSCNSAIRKLGAPVYAVLAHLECSTRASNSAVPTRGLRGGRGGGRNVPGGRPVAVLASNASSKTSHDLRPQNSRPRHAASALLPGSLRYAGAERHRNNRSYRYTDGLVAMPMSGRTLRRNALDAAHGYRTNPRGADRLGTGRQGSVSVQRGRIGVLPYLYNFA